MANRPTSAEMNPGPGFRVKTRIERPDSELIRRYAEFETTDISDMLNRLYAVSSDIQNLTNGMPLVGPAVTVKVFPGDNLMVHKSLDLIQPGDVIVVDSSGTRNTAVIGDLVASKARHKGAAGFIIDGLIRDLEEVRKVGLPVFARGNCVMGPLHRGPGEINYAVNCGGVVVNPGDIVVADRNGAVIVRKEFAEEVLGRLEAKKPGLEQYVAEVKKGNFSNEWVDKLLAHNDCVID
ncbi:RraA family protein [Marinobacter sp. SS21]|uniref:RraA family protein n=1 Tax=Marinobacter sp. SS21 TaxID=2979460 RepID=UPI00232DFF6E|nr:RraA family protein [Marinobacter sp. SS21]MDC0663128.1 RraA family protein [Marinobacter sp. SS21]